MKTEVYSWRLAPALKALLESRAKAEGKSLAELLDAITREWLSRTDLQEDDEHHQDAMRREMLKLVGAFDGQDPSRAEEASRRVRLSLMRRNDH